MTKQTLEKIAVILVFLIPLFLALFVNRDYVFYGKPFIKNDWATNEYITRGPYDKNLSFIENFKNGVQFRHRLCGKENEFMNYCGFTELKWKLIYDYLLLFVLTFGVFIIPFTLREMRKIYRRYWKKQK